MSGYAVGGLSGYQPVLPAPNWGMTPNGAPPGTGPGYPNSDHIGMTYNSPSNLISSSNQAFQSFPPSAMEAPSHLITQAAGARPDTTHKILMVTLLVNALILLAFLASLALELSPRLSRHPGRRFGTPEWRKDNLVLWDTVRVSEATKAQADAIEGGISETDWNARGGRDLSAWLEPAPGEKIDTTPLYKWLRGPDQEVKLTRSKLQQHFSPQDFERLDHAVRAAPSEVGEVKQMLGTFVMQRAFLLALHEGDTPTVDRVAGELGGASKPRFIGHVNTLKSRFFDRILR